MFNCEAFIVQIDQMTIGIRCLQYRLQITSNHVISNQDKYL